MESKRKPSGAGPEPAPPASVRARRAAQAAAPFALLLAASFAAYYPALGAGYIWDDDKHITENRALRTEGGLGRIWFDPSWTPQYYPLVHTTFWIEYRLWGASPRGYHAVNIVLHALAAALVYGLARRLAIPGAALIAGIFALHPVQAESVAWITERKNVLSGVFYLAAMHAYVTYAHLDTPRPADDAHGERRPRGWSYEIALALFVAAMFSKTVACSMPAAALLLVYWKRGNVTREDVAPLAPFFVIGAGLGLLTIWLERSHVGARGAEFELSLVQRFLIAGRAVWFYLGKLAFPLDLAFIYPRWNVSASALWQWLFPLAALLALLILVLGRDRWGRGPLVAALFFGGTLLPALGFINVYPFRYSFVADHFQYLASLGPVALFGAGAAGLAARFAADSPPLRAAAGAAGLGVLLLLGSRTTQQARIYKDEETLWRDTIAMNPEGTIAYTNLSAFYWEQGKVDEAASTLDQGLRRAPDDSDLLGNKAALLIEMGWGAQALPYIERAIELSPGDPWLMNTHGLALAAQGRRPEAIEIFKRAVARHAGLVEAYHNLAKNLLEDGDREGAIKILREGIAANPGDPRLPQSLETILAMPPAPAPPAN